MVYIEIPKEFDDFVIDLVSEKLELAPSYIKWLLSVGNKETLQEYAAAQQGLHPTLSGRGDSACNRVRKIKSALPASSG